MKLKDRCALVTGGAVRIGRAICEALAAKGCDVVVHYDRSKDEAGELVGRLKETGVRAFSVRQRLSTEQDCAALIEQSVEQAGKLDILVNNAAVFHKDTLETATAEKIQAAFQINTLVPVMLTRAFAAHRRETIVGQSRIVNLLDRRIAGNDPECLPYVLSKKMLAAFTRAAALELAPSISVNGVAPGAVLPPPGKGDDRVRDMSGETPLQRRCRPEDVAAAAIFLLESDVITGQIIFVDGGQHLTRE